MAIQMTPLQYRPRKDTMDKVLQGLQIANEVFKVPVAYQDFRQKGANADIAGMEADSLENLQGGVVDPYARIKHGLVEIPGAAAPTAMLPPSGGAGLAPPSAGAPSAMLPAPTALPRGAFSGSATKGGAPTMFATKDALKELDENIGKRRNDVTAINKDYAKAETAISSISELYEKARSGNPAAQLQFTKAFNQFNDTPRFTEGEAKAFDLMASFKEKGELILNKFDQTKGATPLIPGPLIDQMFSAAQNLSKAQRGAQKDALTSTFQDVKAKNFPKDQIFSPQNLKLLEGGDEALALAPPPAMVKKMAEKGKAKPKAMESASIMGINEKTLKDAGKTALGAISSAGSSIVNALMRRAMGL